MLNEAKHDRLGSPTSPSIQIQVKELYFEEVSPIITSEGEIIPYQPLLGADDFKADTGNSFHVDEDEPESGCNKEKCKHIGQALEDPFSKYLGAAVSLMLTTGKAIFGFLPLVTVYHTFRINYELYTKRAASKTGSEILPKPQLNRTRTRSKGEYFQSQVGYFLLWLASVQGGYTYGWGIVQVVASHNSYLMKALVGYTAAMIQHSYHMGAEVELNFQIMELHGAPNYRKTIGSISDASKSLLLIPPALSPWGHRKTSLVHFCIKMAPLYRSGVHIAAIFTTLTKVLGIPSMAAAPLAALFGPFEGDYTASYNQKIAQETLGLNSTKPEGISRVLLAIFDNPVSRLFFNALTLKPLTRLFAVFIDPMFLCKLSKILGSGGMGTAAGSEFREKFPELVLLLSTYFGHAVEFSISDEIPWDSAKETAASPYLWLLVTMTAILLWNGRTQFLSAKKSTLKGEEIGLERQVREHFYGGEDSKTTYLGQVKQRGKVAFHDTMDSLTMTLWKQSNRCEYIKTNANELLDGITFGLWKKAESKPTGTNQQGSNPLPDWTDDVLPGIA